MHLYTLDYGNAYVEKIVLLIIIQMNMFVEDIFAFFISISTEQV